MFIMSVELLHDNDPGLELSDDLLYTSVQRGEALCEVGSRTAVRGANDAGLADERAGGRGLDDGVAGDVQPRIDAEDATADGRGSGERRIHFPSLPRFGGF